VKVVFSRVAWARLEAIQDFIAERSPENAERVVARLTARAASLSHLWRRGRRVPEFDDPGLREVMEGSFRIIYRVVDDAVEIATIFDARLPFTEDLLE